MDNLVRLQKFMAECGIASRRACEQLIEQGRVKVNGETAELGMKVDPSKDKVVFDGRVLNAHSEKNVYIMMNKPRGYLTTAKDELGRKCVIDLLDGVRERVVPVGRLDRDSEGLLLLTNDGDLVYRLTHPKHHVPKIYTCVVKGMPKKEQIEKLCGPLEIDGYVTNSTKVEIAKVKEDRTNLTFTLHEGRNRQIRKMCEKVGLEVLRLKRVAVGELRLAEVKAGKWRFLDDDEVEYLKTL